MKQRLKHSALAIFVSLGMLGVAGSVQAQPGCWMADEADAPQQRMNPEQVRQRAMQRAERSLAPLELALQLREDQRTAWVTFRTAMLQRAAMMYEQGEAYRNASIPANVIETLQRKQQYAQQQVEHLAQMRHAVEALYRHLGEAQRAVFDEEFRVGPGGLMLKPRGFRGEGWGPRRGFAPGVPPAILHMAPNVGGVAAPSIPPAVRMAPNVGGVVAPGIPPAVRFAPGGVVFGGPGLPPAVRFAPGVAQGMSGMSGPLNRHGLPEKDLMPAVGGENANPPTPPEAEQGSSEQAQPTPPPATGQDKPEQAPPATEKD